LRKPWPDVPEVEAAAAGGREDEVVGGFVQRRESAFPEQLGERRGEDDLAPGRFGLERRLDAPAGELPVDMDESRLVVSLVKREGPEDRGAFSTASRRQG
jgi:hypothetical protein